MLAVALALAAPPALARSLDSIVELGNAGAPGLALRLLDAGQPGADGDLTAWFEWERARIALLVRWEQGDRALERLAQAPPGLPQAVRRWIGTQSAWIRLSLEQPAAARRDLRRLLWQQPDAGVSERRAWRRMIVRTYLAEREYADATTAMRRYEQDYSDRQPDWRVLRARVLLSAGQETGVAELLGEESTPEGEALRLLGALREGTMQPGELFELARKRAVAAEAGIDKARWWSLAASAGEAMASSGRVALALDQGVRFAGAFAREDDLFALRADALWMAYERFGRLVGNNLQLLLGNDAAWFEEAQKSLPKSPVRARSLLAVVAAHGADAQARDRAHGRIAAILAEEPGGFDLLKALYLQSSRFPDVSALAPDVRYRLADHALARSDIALATELLATLAAPPPGSDAFAWQLRRARVLVMGGRAAQGAEVLDAILGAPQPPSAAQLDQLMQVLFDLQAVGAHVQATALLQRMLELTLSAERRRELLFWLADSRKALGAHVEAAEGYLTSAALIAARASDPWAQTARYNAAEALTEAGLVDDARRLYTSLLEITDDPKRAAVLRQKLQQLWLTSPAPDNVVWQGGRRP